MSVKRYILDNLFEFVLVVTCATVLCMEVGDAFNISYETLFNVPLVSCVALLLVATGYFGAYRRRNIPIAIAVCILLMAIAVWAGSVTSVEGTFQRQSIGATAVFNDVEGNNLIFGFILAIVPPVSFLLTRRRALCAIYLVAGLFICALMQWLFEEWLWAPFAVFLVAGLSLFIYRCYRLAGAGGGSDDVERTNRLTGPVACLAVSGMLVGLAFAGWGALIAPLNPPAQELKLVRMYYQPDTEWVTHYVSEDANGIDNDRTSSTVGNGNEQTTSDGAGSGHGAQDDPNAETKEGGGASRTSTGNRYSMQGLVEQYRAITYKWGFDPLVPSLIVLVALVFGAIWLRIYTRKRWYAGLSQRSGAYKVCAAYNRISNSLARMRMPKPDSATQVEYAESASGALAAFAHDTGGVDYLRLSKIYERVYFGHIAPTEDELDAFDSFWKVFHRNARKFSGPIRYLYRFWRL